MIRAFTHFAVARTADIPGNKSETSKSIGFGDIPFGCGGRPVCSVTRSQAICVRPRVFDLPCDGFRFVGDTILVRALAGVDCGDHLWQKVVGWFITIIPNLAPP